MERVEYGSVAVNASSEENARVLALGLAADGDVQFEDCDEAVISEVIEIEK